MTKRTNRQRANDALVTLAQKPGDRSLEERATDVITDIAHLLDQSGIDPATVLLTAYRDFHQEANRETRDT